MRIDWRLGSACSSNRTVKLLSNSLQQFISADRGVLSCVLFGSYARGAALGRDMDLLFVVRSKKESGKPLPSMCRRLSALLGIVEVNPVVMDEREFRASLKVKEPAIATILEHSQRLIIVGREYFIRSTI